MYYMDGDPAAKSMTAGDIEDHELLRPKRRADFKPNVIFATQES